MEGRYPTLWREQERVTITVTVPDPYIISFLGSRDYLRRFILNSTSVHHYRKGVLIISLH